jgi:hypothetical protein
MDRIRRHRGCTEVGPFFKKAHHTHAHTTHSHIHSGSLVSWGYVTGVIDAVKYIKTGHLDKGSASSFKSQTRALLRKKENSRA